MAELSVRILGPIEVVVDGQVVDLGGPRPRRLVTALVAAGGKPVSDSALADAVWGSEPPAKAMSALQVYVSRLRTVCGREVFERDSVGYRIRVDPGSVDATRFAESVDIGRRQLADGRPADALRTFTDALASWRGEPYADLDTVDGSRLVELREVALEECAAARLAVGDAPGAVADLEELVRAAPLRERRWALLVLGLYRAGRQGDALGATRRVRTLLADELGVDPGPELQELERRVLAQDLAESPWRATATVRRPLTSFLGRTDDLRTITQRMAEHRLVSLVGPAGVGKTRLAVEYVASKDDAWFARLADVSDAAALPSVVANAVGLVAVHDDPVAAVIRLVGDRDALLVLDNCEHVVTAAAELAVALTAGCPRLRILATSREPLAVDGEVTVPLHPLPADEAVALLVDRVRAVRPGWTPDPAELVEAQRITTALDGLPLAIELAAGRARALGLGEIAERLDDRFALLGPVPKGSVTAHATLQAAIGWSVDLLSPTDRALLLRLWPFEGGFGLSAAEAVGPATGAETLESLSSLVSRSVVAADTTVLPTRYLILESVRAYCRSLDPDTARTRLAHAQWVRDLATQCTAAMRTRRAGWFLQALGREFPNIRAGLAHDLEHDPAQALRSVAQFGLFFTRGVHTAEALRLANAVIAAAPDAPAVDRARVSIIQVALADFIGDFAEARRLVAAADEGVFRQLTDEDDPVDRAELHYFIAFAAVETRHVDIATRHGEAATQLGERHRIRWVAAAGRTVTAVARALRHCLDGDNDAMVADAREAHGLALGWQAAWANAVLAEAYLRHPTGPADEALAAVRVAVGIFADQEDIPFAVDALILGALALAKLGRTADAERLLGGVHAHADRLGFRPATFLAPDSTWVDVQVKATDGSDLTWADMLELVAET